MSTTGLLLGRVFHKLQRGYAKRSKFDWNHASFISVSADDVKQQTLENKAWATCPDSKFVNKFASILPAQQIDSGDMIEFINNRNASDVSVESSPPTLRAISALLTFPLTLAYALSLLFPSHYGRENVNVLIVGARAESSLPLLWWKELLHTNHNILNHHIRMVGPGLQANPEIPGSVSRSISIKDRHKLHQEPLLRTLDITNNYSTRGSDKRIHVDFSKLHEHSDRNDLLRWADVFVLYNPGYGNSTLRQAWHPTIELLLQTRKPVVCTAYGPHDLRRDLHALDVITHDHDHLHQELGEPIDYLIPPHENPYKSFKCTLDEREEGDGGIIITNHFLYAVQAK